MTKDQYNKEIEDIMNDFKVEVEELKKIYHKRVDRVMEKIDEMKIKKTKEKLNS